jgi:drug/metabolite transporter (DMT)-like permease
LAASLIWAFSFGLIKTQLAPYDPRTVAFLRLLLSALAFSPFLRRPGGWRMPVRFAALGALQFGLMYLFYLAAYRYLPAYGVAVATIFTPFYVVAIEAAFVRRWMPRHTLAAVLAVLGAAVVRFDTVAVGALAGFLLVQGSNLCFAAGQVIYRRWRRASSRRGPAGADDLAWMYVGAAGLTGAANFVAGSPPSFRLTAEAWAVIVYLGLLPTAAGFYLWNRGAVRTNAGILAVCNNLKVPLAVAVAWGVFGEEADHVRVVVGLAFIVTALFVAGRDV